MLLQFKRNNYLHQDLPMDDPMYAVHLVLASALTQKDNVHDT